MTAARTAFLALLCVLGVACRAPAPSAATTPPAPAAVQTAPPAVQTTPATDERPHAGPARDELLRRVVLIGASATSGFGARVFFEADGRVISRHVNLADVLDLGIAAPHEPPARHSSFLFFRQPERMGPRFAAEAVESDPTLLIGVDFLFWFGYGNLDRDGAPLPSEAARRPLFEDGLTLLDRFECPLVVGDLPDMSPAIGLMLGRSQVPEPETLDALDRRLDEWAAARSNALVIPFSTLVRRARSDAGFRIGSHEWPAGSGRSLLQDDKLHPTVDGLIAIAQFVAEALIDSGRAAESDFSLDRDEMVERLRRAALGPAGAPAEAAAPAAPGAGP